MEQEAPAGWEFFDSVDFPTDHIDDPMGRPRVRHVVTAVVVGHEGAAWLPRLSEALWALNPRPDRLIAIDTGSTDETAELLASMPGVEPVVSVSARTGFGTAVARGVESVGFAPIPSPYGPYGDDGQIPVVEWLWLLHDDCAPAPKALEKLLLQATITPDVGIWGPKLRLWPRDRDLLEVGVTTSLGGRRDTGIENGELDQGQHDQPRNVLAVSSAGMLVRRDVWESLKGFDPRLPMFRDDIDFGWRASRAGIQVAVAPDAVVYHAQAAATGERALAGTRRHAYQLDRAHAYYTVLANAPGKLLPLLILRFLFGTILRSVWFLIGKTPSGAVDEWTALLGTLLAGGWTQARKDRRNLDQVPYDDIKGLFSRSVNALRHNLEETTGTISERIREAWADEPEEQVVTTARRAKSTARVAVDQPRWRRQLMRRPFLVAWAVLALGTFIAGRSLIGSGVLRSNLLLPAHESLATLWHAAASAPVGVTPPAWLAQFWALSAVMFGPSGAVSVLLIGAIPLAALSAWALLRAFIVNRGARAWGASAYGIAVFTNGAITQGRLGTVVAAIVLPLLGAAVHTVARRRRVVIQGSWRAAWFAAICQAILFAFTPALGLLVAVTLVVGGVLGLGWRRQGRQLVFSTVLGLLLVLPWTIQLVLHPSLLGQEAGGQPTTAIGPGDSLPHLLTGTPMGGPTPWWFAVPLIVVALVSLLRESRQRYELLGWFAALAGLVGTLVASRLGGGSGPLMFLMTAGWVVAVTVAWDSVGKTSDIVVQAVLGVVLVTTIVTGGFWLVRGSDGPLWRGPVQDLPAYLVSAQGPPTNDSILVVRKTTGGPTRFTLVKDGGPRMGSVEAAPKPEQIKPITDVLSTLGGGGSGEEGRQLAALAVDYVYLPAPVDATLQSTLDSLPGLTRASANEGDASWLVDRSTGEGKSPLSDVTHNLWRVLGLIAWIIALIFCLPTVRRTVAVPHGTHARRDR
ncbi:glycosyltransferase family 2 protein [Kribbella antibiotica]|uniref:Glycosyltransferase family 2 protein n=1 Tax=Kribbella antibiotica TaxID=190195 RepID=A0A4R4YVY6_9ACTN|nr:glycosyltransferase family 2 protein [Kribbella antibiotica]TDD49581.1 glycosyltransferase family 2 protein [Kribbella antibiotica]